ncbi:Peptidase S8 and S53, subtilisin, kexin, sedolisin [Nostoc sp. NIES-3756]|uniref:S8 family peptidase n=1 Tax=Nostoc sp. NIES-3756 TaxID=1751286 RepID=UPI00072291B5|nr:S8 family peptidase [Nostoc sp. NIES-3756]BAT53317.1 Peptidase S8 and S53, subtilisin, kexin, sedolisin [Nostoc sp. NIES-3756]
MQHEKLAPGLLLAYQDFQNEEETALTQRRQLLGILPPKSILKPTKSIVFIYCNADADLSHLSQYGVELNQNYGSVRTAFLPLENLPVLSEETAIHRIKPSRQLHLRMDVAPKVVQLSEFQNRTGLTGKGVIIGIIDTGIDAKHPAFSDRILRLWDQTLPGPGVNEGRYGAEFQAAQLTISQDTQGHGTHVAGIAAGADGTYRGVAPEAELIIVKSDLQDAHIADGIHYIFRVAGELGKPAVVNISLGSHGDAHDGSDSLSKIIDAESGPGRIVCCAAGNEGNYNIHGQANIPSGRSRGMRFHVPLNQIGIVWLNAWYSSTGQLEVSVRSPNGFVSPYQKIITDGNPSQSYNLPDSQVEIVTSVPDPANGDYNIFVQIRGQGRSPVQGGVWQLRLRNTSAADTKLDVWALDDNCSVIFTGKSVKDAVKIGSPGCASSAVTVAAYTTKAKYDDMDGQVQEMGLELNTISDFSSEGPLRNNAQKPDIAAPGAMIVSALSSYANSDRSMTINPQFVAMSGTSMAAPFVSGLIALLLQRNPHLNPRTIKDLLRKSSAIPGKPAGTFDPKWGYGLINTANLVE